ncbi:alpha-glucosidase [Actinoplanes sp. ATCC 53533]|uniref:glycoside hydrolase family 97 catalytic domain-containing protein n=1 Tax=Actinoplanes sp. ATCC 53533 TaxID=1288362 RepID=UPI000F77ED01|nr:glycoside hydrolase family 97 catalytic domain-containing protein [Actinoplanes sp. ATCC 53533]RSM46488.1 alpha-glucosidase [Actinoplanes sp. ATCC 53533]
MRSSILRALAAGAALTIGVALLGGAPAGAQERHATSHWVVRAPGDGPVATLGYDSAAGAVTLAVSRGGRPVLDPGAVGIVTEQADLSSGLRFLRRTDRTVTERYTTTAGKRTERRAVMSEARFAFEGTGGARLDLVVRAAPDGVAYRYALPAGSGAVLRETSAFEVPAGGAAWLARYRQDYENPYLPTTAGAAASGEYEHPALFESPGGFLLLTESDVDGGYAGARLVHETGSGRYAVKLWNDEKILVDGALETPWRTMIVGDLGTVSASTLADDLAPPSRVRDASWIKPGKVFWSWLAGGREAGQSLAMQQGYVDYAAEHGWPYALVDAGWYFDPNWNYDPTWETTSWIPELVRYARARGVRILTWIHFSELDTAEERAARLPLFERWGVAGLKVDFMDSESQERLKWYDQILPEAAAHHLTLNFHGSTIPHGIQRTWPHVMTMEAVHGGEKSSNLTTTHLTSLPFTRNVVGSMDYTPMAWHRPSRPTSDAHELALSVVFESGQANLAGRVEDYRARPLAERYLDQVPTVWDETRLLAGRPAESAVFARRAGDRWFIGGGFAGAARTARVPLSLPPGRWLLDITNDGPAGLIRETRLAAAGDTLEIGVAKDGGFAAIACRWRPGLTTCDRPVEVVPATTVTVTPATATVAPGGSFTVTGRFTVDDEHAQTDVTLAPKPPAGWTVRGAPVQVGRVRPGQTVTGTWTVTAPAAPAFGYLDVPVVARFRSPQRHRYFEDQRAAVVHTWRPLPTGWTYLSDLAFAAATNGLGPVERDLTNGQAAAGDGRGIAIRRVTYGKGLGMFASGEVSFALGGRCTRFAADVGVDDEAGLDVARQRVGGTAGFTVAGDGSVLAGTGTMITTDPARALTADLTGVTTLTLRVDDGGDGTQNDRASWADARVRCG